MTQNQPRTWLITGADKVLGFATAKAALERGDQVVVTVPAKDGCHGLAAQYPDTLRAFHLDARDHGRFVDVVAQAHPAFGRIDVLVNNAGDGLLAVAEATTPDKDRPLFEVNVFGLIEMTRAVLPIMRFQRAGHIINRSSKAGFEGATGFALCCASKCAVEGYSESLVYEVEHLASTSRSSNQVASAATSPACRWSQPLSMTPTMQAPMGRTPSMSKSATASSRAAPPSSARPCAIWLPMNDLHCDCRWARTASASSAKTSSQSQPSGTNGKRSRWQRKPGENLTRTWSRRIALKT